MLLNQGIELSEEARMAHYLSFCIILALIPDSFVLLSPDFVIDPCRIIGNYKDVAKVLYSYIYLRLKACKLVKMVGYPVKFILTGTHVKKQVTVFSCPCAEVIIPRSA